MNNENKISPKPKSSLSRKIWIYDFLHPTAKRKYVSFWSIFFLGFTTVTTLFSIFLYRGEWESHKIANLFFLVFSLLSSFSMIFLICLQFYVYKFTLIQKKKKYYSWTLFFLRPVVILTFLSILPDVIFIAEYFTPGQISSNLHVLLSTFKAFRILILFFEIGVFRLFTFVIGKNISKFLSLIAVLIGFALVFSLLFYSAEYGHNPGIHSYFDAFYFSIIAFTTIGFGDIAPHTTAGKALTIFLGFFGALSFSLISSFFVVTYISALSPTKEKRLEKIAETDTKEERKTYIGIQANVVKQQKKEKEEQEKEILNAEKNIAANEKKNINENNKTK